MKKLASTLLPLTLLVSTGCADPEPVDDSFTIELTAETDAGLPLSDVVFSSGKNDFGRSPESGRFTVRLRGAEGSTLPVSATCPEGYESPNSGSLRLTRVKALAGDSENPISYTAICTQTERDIMVVIHAENGAGLPVSVDGEVLGKTDENGNAHVLVSRERSVASLSVSLDTEENSLLQPQNPRRVFELPQGDVVALFNQPLTKARPKRRPHRKQRNAPVRRAPYRLN